MHVRVCIYIDRHIHIPTYIYIYMHTDTNMGACVYLYMHSKRNMGGYGKIDRRMDRWIRVDGLAYLR